jgi:hypothetical protein
MNFTQDHISLIKDSLREEHQNNLWKVTNISKLQKVLKSKMNVCLGIVLKETNKEKKQFIKKFLKNNSLLFPLTTFVYQEITDEFLGTMGLFDKDKENYPLLVIIRDGNNILQTITNICQENSQYVSNELQEIKNEYLKEMATYIQEIMNNSDTNIDINSNQNNNQNNLTKKQINILKNKEPEKIETYKAKYAEYRDNFIDEVAKRRQMEESASDSDNESNDSSHNDNNNKEIRRRNRMRRR